MTLALIAGQGGLPRAVKAAQPQALVCALRGFPPEVPADLTFRLETLGTLLEILSARA